MSRWGSAEGTSGSGGLGTGLDSMTLMVFSNLNYSIHNFPHHKSLSRWQEEALWLFSPPRHAVQSYMFSHSPSALEERCRQRDVHPPYPCLKVYSKSLFWQLKGLLCFLSWTPAQTTGFAKGSVNTGMGRKSRTEVLWTPPPDALCEWAGKGQPFVTLPAEAG